MRASTLMSFDAFLRKMPTLFARGMVRTRGADAAAADDERCRAERAAAAAARVATRRRAGIGVAPAAVIPVETLDPARVRAVRCPCD